MLISTYTFSDPYPFNIMCNCAFSSPISLSYPYPFNYPYRLIRKRCRILQELRIWHEILSTRSTIGDWFEFIWIEVMAVYHGEFPKQKKKKWEMGKFWAQKIKQESVILRALILLFSAERKFCILILNLFFLNWEGNIYL